jgi:hypothetical protein
MLCRWLLLTSPCQSGRALLHHTCSSDKSLSYAYNAGSDSAPMFLKHTLTKRPSAGDSTVAACDTLTSVLARLGLRSTTQYVSNELVCCGSQAH